jgi:hypothetical protein
MAIVIYFFICGFFLGYLMTGFISLGRSSELEERRRLGW